MIFLASNSKLFDFFHQNAIWKRLISLVVTNILIRQLLRGKFGPFEIGIFLNDCRRPQILFDHSIKLGIKTAPGNDKKSSTGMYFSWIYWCKAGKWNWLGIKQIYQNTLKSFWFGSIIFGRFNLSQPNQPTYWLLFLDLRLPKLSLSKTLSKDVEIVSPFAFQRKPWLKILSKNVNVLPEQLLRNSRARTAVWQEPRK